MAQTGANLPKPQLLGQSSNLTRNFQFGLFLVTIIALKSLNLVLCECESVCV